MYLVQTESPCFVPDQRLITVSDFLYPSWETGSLHHLSRLNPMYIKTGKGGGIHAREHNRSPVINFGCNIFPIRNICWFCGYVNKNDEFICTAREGWAQSSA